jgi:DNA polymerase-2
MARASGKQDYWFAPVPGRIVLDGIDALKAASWLFPSFAGKRGAAMLGEGKEIGDDYDKMAEIERRFQEDKPALATYNLKDCELVTRIFQGQLLAFMIERATVTGLQADHPADRSPPSHHYLPRMHREGYVAPNVGDVSGSASPGGFVIDSKPGLYDSVVVLDYKSLYPVHHPHFLVDPVGLIEGEAAEDKARWWKASTAPCSRARSTACPPSPPIWKQRDAAKRAKNEPLSTALKLLMNSFCACWAPASAASSIRAWCLRSRCAATRC